MNKTDLASHIASAVELPHATATSAIDTMVDSIRKALRKSDRVMLVGLGTFSVSKRKARQGRNPQTGKAITIPAARVVKFKAGRELKKLVNRAA